MGLPSLFLFLVAACVSPEYYNPDSQEKILTNHLDDLEAGRNGIRDVFFIGIAPYSTEDVFMNETRYVRELFDTQYGSQGRSLFLVNNLKTLDTYPVATVANMQKSFSENRQSY